MRLGFNILISILLFSMSAYGQDDVSYVQGRRYVDIRLDKLSTCNKRYANKQDRLLHFLKRKEFRVLKRLKTKDSISYALLSNQSLSFDSITKLRRPDSATLAKRNRSGNKVVDSLKSVHSFIGTQSSKLGFSNHDDNVTTEVNNLQQELNYRKYKDELITQRVNSLKSAGEKNKLSGFTSLEKKVFYAKQHMKALKDISEEPTKAEEKALEYLQGTEGFDKHMDQISSGRDGMKGMSPNATSADLEKMGFQTKKQLEGGLKEKFGNNLSSVTQKMRVQAKEFRDKLGDVKGKVKDGKKSVSDIKNTVGNVRNIEKPSFKVNPERGKLFWQRLEKQYNWQTSRATSDKPAMLEASAMVGFKHTPSLTYGLGFAVNIGLGRGWDKIKISFEGIGLRSFANWEWQYGIGGYIGYERMYKKEIFANAVVSNSEAALSSVHNTGKYGESVLIGLTKSYHINAKYNGAIQLLYDIWWNEKGLRSPIILRFSTKTK